MVKGTGQDRQILVLHSKRSHFTQKLLKHFVLMYEHIFSVIPIYSVLVWVSGQILFKQFLMLQSGCVCTDIIGTGIFGKQGSSCLADCSHSVRPASVILVCFLGVLVLFFYIQSRCIYWVLESLLNNGSNIFHMKCASEHSDRLFFFCSC